MKLEITLQIEELNRLHEMGSLSEETHQLAIAGIYAAYQAEASSRTVAQGQEAKAIGQHGVLVGGDVLAPIVTGIFTQNTTVVSSSAPDLPSLERAYLTRLWQQCGLLSLKGIDPKTVGETESYLNLSAIYTALLTKGEVSDDTPTKGDLRPYTRHLSAVTQLNHHRHLVLLGDPGSGKSTFINFIAWCFAGERLGDPIANIDLLTAPLPGEDGKDEQERQYWQYGPLLPVRVNLRDIVSRNLPNPDEPATARHFWEYVVYDLTTALLEDYLPHLLRTLREQGGIFLLDGLDEVPTSNNCREQIKQMVENVAATFPLCHILVTGRTYAYQQQNWRLAGFTEALIAPFGHGQIRRFIDKWYAYLTTIQGWNTQDAQGRAELLKYVVLTNERFLALAERPLLLTLMVNLHSWRGGSLPEKRESLYSEAVDLLLYWWEGPKLVRDVQGNIIQQPSLAEWLRIDRDKVRELLNHLAFTGHARHSQLMETADIFEDELVTGLLRISNNPDLRPARLIEYLSQRSGLLISHGNNIYTFPHRSFQEYLAACYLTGTGFPDSLAELVRKDPQRWREVALLAGIKTARGSSASIWSFVEALCFLDVDEIGITESDYWGAQIAGQLLAELINLDQVSLRHQAKLDRCRRWLLHIMRGNHMAPRERAIAGVSLAHLGDPRDAVINIDAMEFCLVPAGSFWMGSDDVPQGANDFWKPLYEAEKPEHKINIPYNFWLGRYPVTNAQYQMFVEAGGYEEPRFWAEAEEAGIWQSGQIWDSNWQPRVGELKKERRNHPDYYGKPYNLPNHPVVGICWFEALAFARWLNERWQVSGFLPSTWQVHLPSESEWEKGARGGDQVPQAPIICPIIKLHEFDAFPKLRTNLNSRRLYPWGNQALAENANYSLMKIGTTSPVGAFNFGQSPYGCEDMAGNVWEWTSNLYQSYPYTVEGKQTQLPATIALTPLTLRGGAFITSFNGCRCAVRLWDPPDCWGKPIGMRLVVSPSVSEF